jgi:hypothetical protein
MNQKHIIKPGEPLPEAYVKAAMGEDVLLPGEFLVPHEYVGATHGCIVRLLRENGFTKDITVSMNTDEPKVATTLLRRVGGGYTLTTDLAEAWVQCLDPMEIARQHVKRLMGEVEAGRLSN